MPSLPEEVMSLAAKRNGRVIRPGVIGRFREGEVTALAEEIRDSGFWCDVVPLGNHRFAVSVMGYTEESPGGDLDSSGVPA